MTRNNEARRPRARLPRRLIWMALSVIAFLAISAWCVSLLVDSWPLRSQLHRHLEWIADLQSLRSSLANTVTLGAGDSTAPAGGAARAEQATDRLLALTQQLQREGRDSSVRAAALDLTARLQGLRDLYRQPWASISPDVWSDAVFATARSADRMEAVLQPQVLDLELQLDEHWSSLNVLLVITLLLCASNLVFLVIGEKRRRALERARDDAARLLTHDALTGMLNREGVLKLFRHELQRCRRRAEALGMVLADIDRFREINVLVGEEQGDSLLQQVSQRLGAWVRPYDSIGRIGVDSFLILLPGCDRQSTISVAERLREMVEKDEVDLDRSKVRPSISLAHATLDPPEEHDAELLIYRLREALDRVQRGERGLTEVTVDGTGPVPLASALAIEKRDRGTPA